MHGSVNVAVGDCCLFYLGFSLCLCLISSEYMHQQLRKEGRRNENEMQKILASNQRLKMVNSCFLYDIINLLLTETTFLFSFFFFGVLLLDNYFSYILVFLCQVLQRKTEEAFMSTKRLKELLESRKALLRRSAGWEIYFSFHVCFPQL